MDLQISPCEMRCYAKCAGQRPTFFIRLHVGDRYGRQETMVGRSKGYRHITSHMEADERRSGFLWLRSWRANRWTGRGVIADVSGAL